MIYRIIKSLYLPFILLLAYAPSFSAVQILHPDVNKIENGFIKLEAVSDSGDLLFFTIDDGIIYGYSCKQSPCTHYFNSLLLENGEHRIGAFTVTRENMKFIEKDEITINISHPQVPDINEVSPNPGLLLFPASNQYAENEPVGLWLLFAAPQSKDLPGKLRLIIETDAGLSLSENTPQTWEVQGYNTYAAFIELDGIASGSHNIVVNAEYFVFPDGQTSTSSLAYQAVLTVNAAQGVVTFQ